jgi:hypothetical protein
VGLAVYSVRPVSGVVLCEDLPFNGGAATVQARGPTLRSEPEASLRRCPSADQ